METTAVSRIIDIFGTKCEVKAVKTGKVTWSTFGYYEDRYIEGQSAKTVELALSYWENKARIIADSM